MTDYKAEGCTFPRILVDLQNMSPAGPYVTLSRVKSKDGLVILRDFPLGSLNQPIKGKLLAAIEKLDALDISRSAI